MTLRDWFAGKANEEDIQYHMNCMVQANEDCPGGIGCVREAARYRHADAMLEAREES
jgi:hypothetical protein